MTWLRRRRAGPVPEAGRSGGARPAPPGEPAATATHPPGGPAAGPHLPAGLELRLARPSDLPHLAALERQAFPDPWSELALGEELADPHGIFLVVAAPGGAPVAYALFRVVADEAEILTFAVAAAERRRGLGSGLLRQGLARARAAGARACYLEVRAGNAPARALYGRFGFRQVGRRRAYYADGADALLMALDLP
jgi:ribosomal-protein-alanine N-acetyltransferase